MTRFSWNESDIAFDSNEDETDKISEKEPEQVETNKMLNKGLELYQKWMRDYSVKFLRERYRRG